MSERRPTLQAIIDRAVAAGLRDLYTWIPAKIIKWDASKQRADCQILIKNVTRSESDEREVKSWPVVSGVPVEFFGAGGFRITCPISDGSTVIEGSVAPATKGSLQFSHRSLDKWLTGNGNEVDPEFDHDHALTDAKFFPGIMPFGSPWSSMPTDHMSIGYDTGQQLHLHKDTIVAGDEASAQFVALANKVLSELSDIATALSSHKHSGVTTGTGVTGSSDSTYSASSVAGSVLKAKP